MRKSLWIMLAVLLVVIGAPAAHADGVFAITFSGAGAPTVVGSNLLDYNSTSMEFTTPTLTINFDGQTFSLVNQGFTDISPTDVFSWAGVGGGGFGISPSGTKARIYSGSVPGDFTDVVQFGDVTFTAQTPVPEPSSVALMLLGVGLVFVMRKRIGHGLPQAS
jgi:hypothetical protein